MCEADDRGCRYYTYAPCCDKGRPFVRTHTGLGRRLASVHINDMVMTGFRMDPRYKGRRRETEHHSFSFITH